jgi:hypothetical protein
MLSLSFMVLGVLDVHFLLHSHLRGWVWPLDAFTVLVLNILWAVSTRANPGFTARIIDDAGKGATANSTATIASEDSEPEDDRAVDMYSASFFNPLSIIAVVFALTIIWAGLEISFKGDGWIFPLFPLSLLTLYFAYRVLDHGAWLNWLAMRVATSMLRRLPIREALAVLLLLAFQALTALALTLTLFVGWTAYGNRLEVIRFTQPLSGSHAVAAAGQIYLWNALDSVPTLEITRTIRFAEPTGPADWRGGILVLVFRAIVLIPLVSGVILAARFMLERLTFDSDIEE